LKLRIAGTAPWNASVTTGSGTNPSAILPSRTKGFGNGGPLVRPVHSTSLSLFEPEPSSGKCALFNGALAFVVQDLLQRNVQVLWNETPVKSVGMTEKGRYNKPSREVISVFDHEPPQRKVIPTVSHYPIADVDRLQHMPRSVLSVFRMQSHDITKCVDPAHVGQHQVRNGWLRHPCLHLTLDR
jgi:hypothetical protein